jgi:outer membrane autotransporter protein
LINLHRSLHGAIALAVLGSFALATGVSAQTIPELQQGLTIQFESDASGVQQAPQAAEVGRVVASICPRGALDPAVTLGGDLQARCNELAGAADRSAVGEALLQWAPEEAATQGSMNVDIGNAQLKNIGARLAALRGGIGRANLAGLDYGSALGGAASADSGFSRLGFFVNGDLQFGDKDATARESGFDFDSRGITAGLDYRLSDRSVVGAAFGYSNADADIDNNGGNLDADGYSLSLYGSFYPTDTTYVDVSLTRGWNEFEQRRNIVFNAGTPVSQVASSNPDGDYWTGSIGAGMQFNRQAWTYGPHARFEVTRADVDGFAETLSNPAAAGNGLGLRINDQSFRSTTLALGGSVSYAMSTGWGVLLPMADVEYVHEFSNDGDSITGTFVNDPTATAFNLRLDDGDSSYFRVGFGASAQFAQGRSAFVYYQGLLGYDDLSSHSISAGLRLEF